MVTIETVRRVALSFEDAVQLPHFDVISFRVKKKIFATLDTKNKRLCLLLSPLEQSVFCSYDKSVIYPVPNKWGLKGATYIVLDKVKKEMCEDALTIAYCKVSSKRLADKYKLNN